MSKLRDLSYAQPIAETEKFDMPEGLMFDLKAAHKPVLNRPNYLDLPMAIMSEVLVLAIFCILEPPSGGLLDQITLRK